MRRLQIYRLGWSAESFKRFSGCYEGKEDQKYLQTQSKYLGQ